MCSVISSVLVFPSCHVIYSKNDKKYSTPIWSQVGPFALARRYSSSELLGALRNSSLLETVTTDVKDRRIN